MTIVRITKDYIEVQGDMLLTIVIRIIRDYIDVQGDMLVTSVRITRDYIEVLGDVRGYCKDHQRLY